MEVLGYTFQEIVFYLLICFGGIISLWGALSIAHYALLFPRIVTFIVAGFILGGCWWFLFGPLAIIGFMYDWEMWIIYIENKPNK